MLAQHLSIAKEEHPGHQSKQNFAKEEGLAEERLRTIRLFTEEKSRYENLDTLLEAVKGRIEQDRTVQSLTIHKQRERCLFMSAPSKSILVLKSDKLSDYHFFIQGYNSFTQQDQDFFQILINQIQPIEQSLNKIIENPQLFSELSVILSHKKELLFIKAEQGYSKIGTVKEQEQRVIYSRLRTLKIYFDDHFLLQVHRSWLVNPEKVEWINKLSNLKYELKIGKQTIPVGRSYIPKLKQRYPEWFRKG